MKKSVKFVIGGAMASITSLAILINCGGNKTFGYTIIYHAGDGHKINGEQNFTIKNVSEVTLEPTPDYNSNFEFTGWYLNASYTGYQVTFPLKLTSNIDLYAKYTTNSSKEGLTISFDAAEGTNVPNYIIKKGDAINDAPFTSRTNYSFLGWKESENGDYITFPYTPTKSTQLVACWEQTSFKPKLHTSGSKPKNSTLVSGKTDVYELNNETGKIEAAPITKLNGMVFEGWYEDAEFTSRINSFPYSIDKAHQDIYAKFIQETPGPTLTLIDGETKQELTNCLSVPYPPAPITTNSKKLFVGWSTTQGGDKIEDYTPYKSLTNNLTLYALWSDRDKATIKFYDATDTTNPIQVIEDKYCVGDTITETPQLEVNECFELYGWKLDPTSSTYVSFAEPYPIESTELKFYGDTKRVSFNLEVRDSEKTNNRLFGLNKQNRIEGLQAASVAGREDDYEFDCYSYDQTGSEKIGKLDFDLASVSSRLSRTQNTLIIYAQWKNNRKYKVNIDYGDGKKESTKITRETPVSNLPKVESELKTVSYWVDEEGNKYGTGAGQSPTIPPKELNLTAVWENKYRTITVMRGGKDDKVFTEDTYDKLDKTTAYYKDIPYIGESKHKLVGYYTEDPTAGGTPHIASLEDEIPQDITKVWECWEQIKCDVTVKYIDQNGKVFLTEEKKGLLNQMYLSYIVTTLTDYEFTRVVKLNGKDVELIGDDPIINFEVSTNVLEIYYRQTQFTVTYKIQYPGTNETHVKEHQSTVENYDPGHQKAKVTWCGDWYYDAACENIVDYSAQLTKDITVYTKWSWVKDDEFNITFNVGSSQLLAQFENGEKSISYEKVNAMTYTEFPVCTCEGNTFVGWFASEIGSPNDEPITHLDSTTVPAGGNLYARWRPTEGYGSICFKLGEGGQFDSSKNDTGLMTIKNGTKYGDIKNKIPSCGYEYNEYNVAGWSTTSDGKHVITDDNYEFTFTEDKNAIFLYATKKENVQTPSGDITKDNWATINAVAQNKVPGKTYANGYQAIIKTYGENIIGKEKAINYNNIYARVVGLNHDFGDKSKKTKLPITFELVQLIDIAQFDSNGSNTWEGSSLQMSLYTGGEIFSKMPKIISSNAPSVFKYVDGKGLTENKFFIPDCYELNINEQFKEKEEIYEYYKGKDKTAAMKEYLDMGYTSYHLRTNGRNYLKIYLDSTTKKLSCKIDDPDQPTRFRGVCLMFCLGTPYTYNE